MKNINQFKVLTCTFMFLLIFLCCSVNIFAWGLDVHTQYTRDWAVESGFSEADGQKLGLLNMATDVSPNTGGWPLPHDEFHFNMNSGNVADINSASDTRNIKKNEYYKSAVTAYKNSNRDSALNDLGTALHALQDIYAHGNVQTMDQHNSFKYNGNSIIDDINYDINWSTKQVTSVAKFSGKRYLNTKQVSLDLIKKFIADASYKK